MEFQKKNLSGFLLGGGGGRFGAGAPVPPAYRWPPSPQDQRASSGIRLPPPLENKLPTRIIGRVSRTTVRSSKLRFPRYNNI